MWFTCKYRDVQSIDLSSFIWMHHPNKILVVKLDIEGAELFALKGGKKTIMEHKPIILMEVCSKHIKNFNYTVNDIYNFFDKINYKPVAAIHNSQNFTERSKIDMNFNDDIIFVHKSKFGKINA